MTHERIDYPAITNKALYSIPYKVLSRTKEIGLTGKHYFIIKFNVKCKGVSISGKLKEVYPNEMALLIKDQYSNLKVNKSSFSLSIEILGEIEQISVPFKAMISFLDPSMQFGLEFAEPIKHVDFNKAEMNSKMSSEMIQNQLYEQYGNNVVSFKKYCRRKKTKAIRRSL